MKTLNHTIDCALLSYQKEKFLLPLMSIAEIISLDNIDNLQNTEKSSTWVGEFLWQEIPLIVVTLPTYHHYSSPLWKPKIVVMHALFSQENFFPFFAILFEGASERVRVSSEDVEWNNASQKKANLINDYQKLEVTLVDIWALSQRVEGFQADLQIPI